VGLDHTIGRSRGTDFFRIADQLTLQEREYWRRTRDFVDDEVLPVINGYWERAEFPRTLVGRLGELGIVGDGITGYGCPPMSPIASGLIHLELNRGDGSLGTFLGVQAGLAMQSIAMLGSQEQKQRWLPPMARVETLGAFALLTGPAPAGTTLWRLLTALDPTALQDALGAWLRARLTWRPSRSDRRRRRGRRVLAVDGKAMRATLRGLNPMHLLAVATTPPRSSWHR